MHVGSPAFVVQMPDGDRILPATDAQEAGVKNPCWRPWNRCPASANAASSFLTPRGERPEFVLLEEQFKSQKEAAPVKWAVSGAE